MLRITGKTERASGRISRRSFLRVGAIGPMGLTLADYLALRASGRTTGGKAQSVILLWLWGAPSQLDTFDMKPDAPIEYRGPFVPIATKVPGLSICELLPNLARCADKFSLVRTIHHNETDHGIAGTMGLTGSRAGARGLGDASVAGAERPSTGAIVGRLHRRRPGSMPPVCDPGRSTPPGEEAGRRRRGRDLGSAYDPFRLRYEPGAGVSLPDARLPEKVSAARLEARWDLRHQLDGGITPGASPAARFDRHYELAHTLIASSQSLAALDVEREPAAVRRRYGPHRFGQCCLIARRLVEAGQPFVQVNWSTHVEAIEDSGDGGWDMHDRYFAIMQDRHGWMFDRALSALIEDLDRARVARRDPGHRCGRIRSHAEDQRSGGPRASSQCYTALLAGGGVQGGRAIGTSDKRAEHPVDRPFSPADLGATILARLGIGAADLTGINLTPDGQVIEELF